MNPIEDAAAAITLLVLEELAECGDGNILPARHELSQDQFNSLVKLIEGGLDRVRFDTIEQCRKVCIDYSNNLDEAYDIPLECARLIQTLHNAPP